MLSNAQGSIENLTEGPALTWPHQQSAVKARVMGVRHDLRPRLRTAVRKYVAPVKLIHVP